MYEKCARDITHVPEICLAETCQVNGSSPLSSQISYTVSLRVGPVLVVVVLFVSPVIAVVLFPLAIVS